MILSRDTVRGPIVRPLSGPLAVTAPLAAAFGAALGAAGCDGTGAAGAHSPGAIALPLPEPVLSSRAIDREALEVDVRVGGDVVETRREGGLRLASTTVPAGRALTLEVSWYERFGEEGNRLEIASLVDAIEPLSSDSELTIDPARYTTDGLDADGDGFSNLAEREGGTGPYDGADPGDAAPPDDPLVVPFVDLSVVGAPEIDGFYDEGIWDEAQFQRIDTLLIGGDPANPREQSYAWGAMHDGASLYLIVRFEGEQRTDRRTPHDDSERFEQDDALNLFIDPDHDRSEFLELATNGGDDRYLVFPLPADAVEPRVLTPFDEPPNRVENLPPSLAYEAASGRDVDVAGWEIVLSLEELGIVVGEPFGIELHLDQDLDGGDRDERWAWAYPSRLSREAAGAFEGYNFESPARFGTAVLARPPG